MKNKETLEEAAEKYENSFKESIGTESVDFIAGAKSDAARDYWFKQFQQEQDKNKYSEEDMISFATFYYTHQGKATEYWGKDLFKEWFEQFKKK
jgi:hypothetical protein